MDLRIEGANRLDRLGRAFKKAEKEDVKKALYRAMNRTGKPLREEAVAASLYVLPKRGGLAETVALRDFTIKVTQPGKNVVVRLRSGRRHNVVRWNRGIVRHPVYADASEPRSEWHWVYQRFAEPGWLDTALDRVAPAVRPEVIKALTEVFAALDNNKLRA